ncbi:MAG: thiamine phosphate synthase [Pyrinomonadaceae bacterium]
MTDREPRLATYAISAGTATDETITSDPEQLLNIVRFAVSEKVTLFQLREKHLSARLLYEITTKCVDIVRGSSTLLLVNDRPDVALAAGAHGVHLPATGLPPEIVREVFSGDLIIGVSCHHLDEAVIASNSGANFVTFGPVFPTPGKSQTTRLSELSLVCERLGPFPVIALGGIDETNVQSVLQAGASGVAGIRAFNEPRSMRSIIQKIRNEPN